MTPTAQHKIFTALCAQCGLPNPVPEYQFCPGRKWRIDYYFQSGEKKVALEVEGGVHTNGRHVRAAGFLADMEKYNALAAHNIFLIRTVPSDLLTMKTVRLVQAVLDGEFGEV